jgi:hypothetical protein
LRDVLRRTVEGVSCLFVAHGLARLAYAQVHFVGGDRRSYLIASTHWLAPAGRTHVHVVSTTAPAGCPSVDLRTPAGVAHTLGWMEDADVRGLRPSMELLHGES